MKQYIVTNTEKPDETIKASSVHEVLTFARFSCNMRYPELFEVQTKTKQLDLYEGFDYKTLKVICKEANNG